MPNTEPSCSGIASGCAHKHLSKHNCVASLRYKYLCELRAFTLKHHPLYLFKNVICAMNSTINCYEYLKPNTDIVGIGVFTAFLIHILT